MRGPRTAVVWILQSLLVCLLLFLLWQPALSIATLRPQQNIVAVVIDDSKSMATQEDGQSRKDQVLRDAQRRSAQQFKELNFKSGFIVWAIIWNASKARTS